MCTDICGPLHPYGITGDAYFASFTDVGSRFTFVTPIRKRADVAKEIADALQYARLQTYYAPTILHIDNTRECIYISTATLQATKHAGTIVKKLCHITQNKFA